MSFRTAAPSGTRSPHRGRGAAAGLVCWVLLVPPVAATADQGSSCAVLEGLVDEGAFDFACEQKDEAKERPEEEVVCRTSKSPAEDWFLHGLDALAKDEGAFAACALHRAMELDPAEDGHDLVGFGKSKGVKCLPRRSCNPGSAVLDRKKYFPRLYLAVAYLQLAPFRLDEETKKELCRKALESLSESRKEAPEEKEESVRRPEERKEIDRNRPIREAKSLCCELLKEDHHRECPEGEEGVG